jgi:saccharopine dehydrogenase-like NADP-dependent oxidoreductase
MAQNTVEKVRVLVDFGFAGEEPVNVKGNVIQPRDLMISLLSGYVHSISDLLSPPEAKPPDWTKEIVTEIKGTKDGKDITYRLGTLTCKGALPTGAAPAIAAIWLAEGRIEPGVYPPETAIVPESFFDELEQHQIYTQVTTTTKV